MKKMITVPFAVVASLMMVVSAGAETTETTDTAKVGIQSGEFTLNIQEANSFGTVVIEKQPKTVTAGFVDGFNLVDARGTQEGWKINLTATPFKVVEPAGGFASGTSAFTLPQGSLAIDPLEVISRVGEGSGEAPKNVITEKTVIDDGEVTLVNAEIGEGLGEFSLTFPDNALSLVVDPTTARVDTVNYTKELTPYESTVTWSLVSAP